MYKLIHFFSFHDRLKLVKSYSLTSRHQNVPKRLFFHPSVSANTKQPYLLICILNLIYLSFFLIQFSNCDVRINNHYRQSKGFTTDRRQFYCQPFLKGISKVATSSCLVFTRLDLHSIIASTCCHRCQFPVDYFSFFLCNGVVIREMF